MRHPNTKRLTLRPLAKLVLPAAIAAILVLGSAPARAQNPVPVSFLGSYDGLFTPQFADDGSITIHSIIPGSATFQPQSRGYFSHFFNPNSPDPTVVNGVLMLFGGANGTMFGTYQGTQTPPDPFGVMQISGTFRLVDGWLDGLGAATGSGTFSGVVQINMLVPEFSEMTMTLVGVVSPAASG